MMSMPSCHDAANNNMCYVGGDVPAYIIIVTGILTVEMRNPGLIPGRSEILFSPQEVS